MSASEKTRNFADLVIEKVKQTLEKNCSQSVSHRLDHLCRVCKRAIKIANEIKGENIDMEVLKISALLHDIDQPYNEKQNHVNRSLLRRSRFLKNSHIRRKKLKKF